MPALLTSPAGGLMRYLIHAASGAVCLSATLAGCIEPQEGLTLTGEDNGRAITIAVAESFIVCLDSNATTGYAWELGEMDTVILESTDQEYVEDIAPPGMSGVGGTEIWEFAGKVPGRTDLRLEYRRPWELEEIEPADTFTIEVTVTAAE
jgi:predicted secreted protein